MKWFEKLRLAREQAGYRQADMAEVLGYKSVSTYNKLENGELKDPPFEKVALAASIVGASLDFMVDEMNDEPPEFPLTDDELLILQLIRDLGLDRAEAMRRLAASAPRSGSGTLREIAGPADLTPLLRAHQAKAKPRSKLKPTRDDEGSDVGDTPATAER